MKGTVGGYVVNGRPYEWVHGKSKGGYMVNGRPCESVRSK